MKGRARQGSGWEGNGTSQENGCCHLLCTVPTLALEAGMNARDRFWSTQVRAMKYWDRGGGIYMGK